MFNLSWKKISILTVVAIVGFSQFADAQKRRSRNNQYYDNRTIHFGFTVGLNSSTFKTFESLEFNNNDTMLRILPVATPGVQLGIISDLRMGDHASLRFIPSLMFSERHLEYSFTKSAFNRTKRIESTYIHLPLLLKFRSDRISNYRVYVVGGPKFSIDMSSQEDVVEDLEKVKILRQDFSIDFGVGVDLYLPYFKFSPEIRLSQGLSNLLVAEEHQFSNTLDRLLSQTIVLAFHFE